MNNNNVIAKLYNFLLMEHCVVYSVPETLLENIDDINLFFILPINQTRQVIPAWMKTCSSLAKRTLNR